ncbi:MAG: gluconate transporter [Chitinophagaceae bacterium]|nr:MAG: gluconate transporter [Chitinophagaceae bacterium]
MQLVIIGLSVAIQIFLTAKKISPFISLLIIAIMSGLLLGMEPMEVIRSVERGVANTLGGLALIICLGAILGKLLEVSGAAERISGTLITAFGTSNIQWAVLLTGFLIGIPLYYNAGFVILVPLVFSISRRASLPLMYVAIPMAASLSTTHCFLPPHPSPVFLVNAFRADMGKTLVYGLMITVPVVIIAGPLLGRLLRKMIVPLPEIDRSLLPATERQLPPALPSFLLGLLPVILITTSVLASSIPGTGIIRTILLFAGDSTIALLISVLFAIYYFGVRTGAGMPATMKWLNDAISGISVILLIITAGGVFKQVLQDSGTDRYIASFSTAWNLPPLLFGWMITALLRVAIGSATVAGITAAGVVSPLVLSGTVSPELMVLAIGTGSVFGSHVNDSGFWMFKEFFNLTMRQTFLSWSVMETSISILGLIGVLLLDLFI